MLRPTVVFLLAIFLLPGLGCSPAPDPLRDVTLDETNRAEISARLGSELTLEEGQLLNAYLERNHPELSQGQLPLGISVGEMIAAQRTFEKTRVSGDGTSPSSTTTPTETADRTPASADRPASRPPAASPRAETAAAETPPATATDNPPAAAAATPEPPRTVTVPAETPLLIRLDQSLSSKNARSGQRFEAHLDENLELNGQVVAPRGSRIEGRVVDAEGSGRVKGRARMSLELSQLWVGDTAYDLSTNRLSFQAEKGTKDDALKIGIGAAAGAVIGAIAGGGSGAAKGTAVGAGAGTGAVLLTKGEEVEFAAEQKFEFRLDEPLTVPVG